MSALCPTVNGSKVGKTLWIIVGTQSRGRIVRGKEVPRQIESWYRVRTMPGVATLAERIIREQKLVIGPLQWAEAEKVAGLKVASKKVSVSGSSKEVLARLVGRYE